MPVDDYYSLIGVSSDADRDTIRDAYRARRSELDDSENGRASAALLNRAWNVLSDTAQRAKYDDQLAAAKADDDVIVPELVGATRASANGSATPRSSNRDRRGRERPDRPVRQPIPQDMEINGVALASNRDRAFSLAIDALLCVILIAIIPQFLTAKLAEGKTDSSIPASVVVHEVDNGNKTVTYQTNGEITKYTDALQQKIDDEDQANIDKYIKLREGAKTQAQKDQYNAEKKKWETQYDKDKDAQADAQKLLEPAFRISLAVCGVIALLAFAIPAGLTGRTAGKAFRKVRLMQEDAVTPAGWKASFLRYGLVIGFVTLAGVFLGQAAQIAWIVAIFGVTSFARNPKRQGWHDRIGHTVVVQG